MEPQTPTTDVHDRLRAALDRAAAAIDRADERISSLEGALEAERVSAVAAEAERATAAAADEHAASRIAALEAENARLRAAAVPVSRGRRAGRLAAGTLVAGGLSAAAWGGVTTLWGDPVSARYTAQAQVALDRQVAALEAAAREAPAVTAATRREAQRALDRRVRRSAAALAATALPGTGLGRLDIPRIGLRMAVTQGTATEELRRGPGHYPSTGLPGMGRTVGIAGHRTTFNAPLRQIDRLERGDRIVVRMPYGRFTYRVTGHRIVAPADVSVLRSAEGRDRLVLTACHPPQSDAQRYVVFARLDDRPTPKA